MEDNKEKIEPKKSLIRTIFFIIYHLGFIVCMITALFNFDYAFRHIDSNYPYKEFLICLTIGMHFFGSLLYNEYTRKDK